MVAAQVIGNDATIALAGQSGNFQLNVMLPIVAHNTLESFDLLSHAAVNLSDKTISGMNLKVDRIHENLRLNPIMVTALNSLIGYDKGAEIAKKAYAERRPILDVAIELTDILAGQLEEIMSPEKLS